MKKYLIINTKDNVAVALENLKKGEKFEGVTLLNDIPFGHKFSLKEILKNDNVIKYGFPIGHASKNIKKGEHIHSHNLVTNLSNKSKYFYKPIQVDFDSKLLKEKVNVYQRKFDKVGIRNNLMIVPLVGCVNSQAEKIKENILKKTKGKFIDEVIVAKHPYGCSQLGDDHLNTVKILQSLTKHPNNGGVLVLALGCENNQLENFQSSLGEYDVSRVKFLKAQDVKDEIKEGTKICLRLIELMKKDKRVPKPISEITIGLKCGGSDGLSGITANPLIGKVSDFLSKNNGSVLLSEVPEMFGAEHILMNRAKNENVFSKIVDLINNFKNYFSSHNQTCYENPSPGNKEGGITTLEEKSLGCIEKAGHSFVQDVIYAGDSVKIKGLNLLNGPGNDMVSCTNLASCGAHLILFSTGRGTPFGTVVPTIKISTNTKLADTKSNWIDFNAGTLIEGKTFKEIEKDLISLLIKTINGEYKTKNEINKFQEIAIFKDGVTL